MFTNAMDFGGGFCHVGGEYGNIILAKKNGRGHLPYARQASLTVQWVSLSYHNDMYYDKILTF